MNQFILALCGLPSSGKSTLADALQKALNFEVEIVRTDDWRDDEYYTEWSPEREKPVRLAALDRVRELVALGHNVIHEDTNYYASMRHELYEIALEMGCGFAIIHVSTPVDVALKWNRERPDSRIPDSVIESISERFDLPGSRYLWDISDYEAAMDEMNLSRIVAEIMEVIDELEPLQKPRPQSITSSDYNRLDAETRLIVSKFLREHSELRENRRISKIRRRCLREASEKKIPVEEIHEFLWAELSKLL